jgi:hypothetical protein
VGESRSRLCIRQSEYLVVLRRDSIRPESGRNPRYCFITEHSMQRNIAMETRTQKVFVFLKEINFGKNTKQIFTNYNTAYESRYNKEM